MSATQERDQAARIAAADLDQAVQIANNIGEPWFRCQAQALAAWYESQPDRFLGLIDKSLESGWSITDPNRSATVVAWPVAALANRRFHDLEIRARIDHELETVIAKVAEVITREPSPVSRADALLTHIHALSPARTRLRAEVLDLLVKECANPANWKRERQIEEAALVVAGDDQAAAIDLASSLKETRKLRTIARIEARSEWIGPWLCHGLR